MDAYNRCRMRLDSPRNPLVLRAGVPTTAGFRDESSDAERSLEDLARALDSSDGGSVVLDRGDCLQRLDFPALFALVRAHGGDIGLATTGISLRSPAVLDLWGGASGPTARVTLFSGVPEVHDWIADAPGEARQILRGVRPAAEAGVRVHVQVPLARPAVLSLPQTVAILAALGVGSVGFRMLRLDQVPIDRRLALGARVGVVLGPLAAAAAEALRGGLGLELAGIPTCVLPASLAQYVVAQRGHCASCGQTGCCGLSPTYVETFGDLELRPSPEGDIDVFELCWTAAEPRREVRRRLVRALEHRAKTLRVTGAMDHPAAAELLREAVRASPAVSLEADLAPLLGWSDDELHRVRKLVAVKPTVASAAATRAVERLAGFGVSA